jgi:hypothetical protein
VGLPDQDPVDAVSVWPSAAAPAIDGAVVSAGGTVVPPTTPDRTEAATEPTEFETVKLSLIVEPASALVTVYVPVFVTYAHPVPALEQRCHWRFETASPAEPDQPPIPRTSTWPACGAPASGAMLPRPLTS